jgi:predicted peptidase
VQIPEDQWADMERDPKTGSWTATIPLQEGASRVDFFTNHGHMSNGYRQYLSSPYTRVELSPSQHLATAPFSNAQAQQPSEEQLAKILKRFPEADTDKDGKLTTEEIQQFSQSRQRNTRPAAAAQPTQARDAKLTETLAGINARGTGQRFKNIELELFEWPSELHEKLGKMKKFAFVARPVEKVAGKLPLIIYLHGGAQRWWDKSLQEQLAILLSPKRKMLRGFDFAELAGKGLILLEPNTEGLWNADSLDTMLDYVLENFPEIDKDRVYVMGYSMGGKGTWVWINESADRFAAAAAGGFSGGSDKDNVKKLARLPIWGMAGSDDGGSATGMRKMVERLKAAGNVNVKCTVFEGGHKEGGEGMFSTTVELVDWMLGFKRPKTTE